MAAPICVRAYAICRFVVFGGFALSLPREMIKSYFRTTAQKPEEEAAVEQRGLAELRAETATALASSAGALPADNLLAVVTKDAAKRDTLLLRYLRSYSGDAAKASKAFKTMLLWRQRMKLEEVAEAMRYLGGPGIGLPLWVSPLRRKEEPRLGMTYCALAHVPKKFDYKMLERGCGVVFDWLLYVRDGVEAESLVSVVDFAGFSVSQADISAMKTSVVSYVHVCRVSSLLLATIRSRFWLAWQE